MIGFSKGCAALPLVMVKSPSVGGMLTPCICSGNRDQKLGLFMFEVQNRTSPGGVH